MTRLRVVVAAGALLVLTNALSPAGAETSTVAVDRQSYTSDLPAGDPCEGTRDICVGATAGTTTARAFVHIAIESLPAGANLSELELKLVVDASNARGNAAVDVPSLQACVLAEPLPADPQEQGAPAMDCERASTPGEVQDDGSWQFDLTLLARVWQRSSNTGAAIVPVTGEDTSSAQMWSVAFLTTSTRASAVYSAPVASAPAPPAVPSSTPQLPPPLLAAPPTRPEPRIETTNELIPDPLPRLAADAAGAEPRLQGVIVVRTLWLLVAFAVAMLALGMLGGATYRNVRAAEASWRPSDVLRALASARSQTAVAFALLAVAAMVALGAAGHAASVPVGVGP